MDHRALSRERLISPTLGTLGDALWAVAAVVTPRSLRELCQASRSVRCLLSPVAEQAAKIKELVRSLRALPLRFNFQLDLLGCDALEEALLFLGPILPLRRRERAGKLAGWVPTEEEIWHLKSRADVATTVAAAQLALQAAAGGALTALGREALSFASKRRSRMTLDGASGAFQPLLLGTTLRLADLSEREAAAAGEAITVTTTRTTTTPTTMWATAPVGIEWAEGPAADPLQLGVQLRLHEPGGAPTLAVELTSGGWSDWAESWSLLDGTLQVAAAVAVALPGEGHILLRQAPGAAAVCEVTLVPGLGAPDSIRSCTDMLTRPGRPYRMHCLERQRLSFKPALAEAASTLAAKRSQAYRKRLPPLSLARCSHFHSVVEECWLRAIAEYSSSQLLSNVQCRELPDREGEVNVAKLRPKSFLIQIDESVSEVAVHRRGPRPFANIAPAHDFNGVTTATERCQALLRVLPVRVCERSPPPVPSARALPLAHGTAAVTARGQKRDSIESDNQQRGNDHFGNLGDDGDSEPATAMRTKEEGEERRWRVTCADVHAGIQNVVQRGCLQPFVFVDIMMDSPGDEAKASDGSSQGGEDIEEEDKKVQTEPFPVPDLLGVEDSVTLTELLQKTFGDGSSNGFNIIGALTMEATLSGSSEALAALVCSSLSTGSAEVLAVRSADASRELLGCCVLRRSKVSSGMGRHASGAIGEVALLAVRPEHQGRGLGTSLLRAAEERLATKHQCEAVQLEIRGGSFPGSAGGYSSGPEEQKGSRKGKGRGGAPERALVWLRRRDYAVSERGGGGGSGRISLVRMLPLGFVSRALARVVGAREAMLMAELAAVEADAAKAEGASSISGLGPCGTASVSPAATVDSMLLLLPYEVSASVARCLGLASLGAVACTCHVMTEVACKDAELWRFLFEKCCWPPSAALADFAEGVATCRAGVDWRERMRARAVAPPSIVVDIGRGYTKYGLVHGIRGRPEGEGHPPTLVQLCSSPTHPSDCDHNEQLQFIHTKVDDELARAAADAQHPLHWAALESEAGAVAQAGGRALLCGLRQCTDLNGCVVRLESFDQERGRFVALVVCLHAPLMSGNLIPDGPPTETTADSDDEESDDSGPAIEAAIEVDLAGLAEGVASQPESAALESQVSRIRRSLRLLQSLSGRSGVVPHRQAMSMRLLVDSCHLKPVRRARDLPLLIGEPFAVTASGGMDGRSRSDPDRWALAMQAQLGVRRGPMRIVPQAQMALWAHGIDHGIVVNIGQGQAIAIPVVEGEVVASAACGSDIGSGSLTQLMMRLLSRRFSFLDSRVMTWCRDLKEAYCYVSPPPPAGVGSLLERFNALQRAGGDVNNTLGMQSVSVDAPFAAPGSVQLDIERVVVPEALFDASLIGGPTVQGLVLSCIEKVLAREVCDGEALRALLRNVVLVGGAADIPGMRPRTEFEIRKLLAERGSSSLKSALASTDDCFVLNPPLADQHDQSRSSGSLTSPRFAPFFGGCVRAASSSSVASAAFGKPSSDTSAACGRAASTLAAVPGIAAWVRRQLFSLNAPAIFRAGGGGGEEDAAWALHHEQERPGSDAGDSESEWDAEEESAARDLPDEQEEGEDGEEGGEEEDATDDDLISGRARHSLGGSPMLFGNGCGRFADEKVLLVYARWLWNRDLGISLASLTLCFVRVCTCSEISLSGWRNTIADTLSANTMTKTFEEYQKEKREREWKEKVQKQKEALGNAERVKRATDWKAIGNEKFKVGNLPEARDYYREAIILVEDLVEARRKERNDLLVPLYANLAQVYLRLGEDLIAVLKLEPESEEAAKDLALVRAALAEKAKEARAVMGGFLNREAAKTRQRDDQKAAIAEKLRLAEERRRERRARAEQRQQMQDAFAKLAKSPMLYEEREKEMEPIRQKELEKKQTLELEQNLLNIIDESKGKPKVEKFDAFMQQKEDRCREQSQELDQKKKVLDKLKKESDWQEDDSWRGQREEHRKQIEARGSSTGPRQLWDSTQVGRWCEQHLRKLLVKASVTATDELEPELLALAKGEATGRCVLRALVTDVLKFEGDAAVMRLNLQKPPLHYFDYFLKLEWEVAIAEEGDEFYRTAEELIQEAAQDNDNKAPPSIAKNRILAGTFKTRMLCSEEEPADGKWALAVKVKRRFDCQPKDGSPAGARGARLEQMAQVLRDRLLEEAQRLLCRWAQDYREYWA
ncbi:unnamed protein product [Polarella glacialis]|uniref:N-acetyltransferase domain-containing protein n=1 Tax=Polarella glacialis TaxID=89957 RepID=A0A813EKY6_POLGL|nr:unnamed protein product [Polarella glacialis]